MNDLERVRSDLDAMERAAGFGLSFDERDVRRARWTGIVGVPLAIWGVVGPIDPPWGGVAIVATLLAVMAVTSLGADTETPSHATPPFRWREHGAGMVFFSLVTLAALGYVLLATRAEWSWAAAMATAIFFAGICCAVPAIFDSGRRHMLGGAVPTVAYGALFPLYGERELVLATALWIISAGLATARIMRDQLRGARDDAAD